MDEKIFPLFSTINESKDFKDLEIQENAIGPDNLLNEILNKKVWSNAEILWVLKRIMYFYGKKDKLLLNAPKERIFTNMVDILRAFYLILDKLDPEIDENMRSYISAKLGDATWGINENTRCYLHKINN